MTDERAGRAVCVLGAGAFGTALALVMAAGGRETLLWGRPGPDLEAMAARRENARRLPGFPFPPALRVTDDLAAMPRGAVVLLAVPTQTLRGVIAAQRARLAGHFLVACCKGVERGSGLLPTEVIADVLPGARSAVLTGPSFAADIAAGKPTALTFATTDPEGGVLQELLSTPTLRLYLDADPKGAQLGGALKNVVAIGAGIAIGAGLGESARAALMTRGFAEMRRHAMACGARPETLSGLSGFGDLVLTCTSAQSRNLRHGLAIGAGRPPDASATVEGVETAHALAESAGGAELPVTRTVSAILKGAISVAAATEALMSRPLRRENEGRAGA